MEDNKKKDSFKGLPVENHETAAWIENWDKVKPKSQVIIPKEHAVGNSKEWVDSNEL